MSEFIHALLQQSFLQSALLSGLLASLACGLVGPLVVVKRIAFLAGGIAHSVLGGMGAALYYGFDPFYGALVAALISAVLIGLIHVYWRVQEDTLIGAIWSIGMAVGILFISQTPGYNTDLMSFLFGNILLVPESQIWWMLALDLMLLLLLVLFYRPFIAVAFDEEFARLRGLPVALIYLLLLSMVAITVVLLLQVVGLILVIALLTLPSAIAGHYAISIGRMMLIATLLGMLFTSSGLWIAYAPDLPVGPVIILLAGSGYIISLGFSRWLERTRSQRHSRLSP